MPDRLEHRPPERDSVVISPGGTLIYVLLRERSEFDKIARPCTEHSENEVGHVLTKAVDGEGVYIVFQYWLKSRTAEAIIEDHRKLREKNHA